MRLIAVGAIGVQRKVATSGNLEVGSGTVTWTSVNNVNDITRSSSLFKFMAENIPSFAVDSDNHPRYINLATINRMQLIGHPPEEMLRPTTATKRKRTRTITFSETSFRRRKTLPSARPSRGATPFIPYEPPTDVFTPPREVFLSPVTNIMSKSSKRKTVVSTSSFKSAKFKKKGSTLTIVTAVKQELPDIDLTLPMPPPSPTDDPLLLLGPPEFDFLLPEPTPLPSPTDDPLLLSGPHEFDFLLPEPKPPSLLSVPPKFDFFLEPTPSIKREMSVQVQAADEDLSPSLPESPIAVDEEAARVFDWDFNKNNEHEQYDDRISDDSDELSHGIVKMTGVEPRSAVRAVETLKQNDYDRYTNIDIKPLLQEVKQRRKSDIEDSVKESRRHDVFEAYDGDICKQEWTKQDWKHLEACFTDQRLEVGLRLSGAKQNILASVDMVSIDDVVDKFVISKGGFETITRFGELWSRENLLKRTRALQKKQRSRNIALPTTPYTPLSVNRIQISDFTPLRRWATLPRKSRPRSTSPQSDPLLPEQETFPKSEINDALYSSDVPSTIAISERGSTASPKQETFSLSEFKDMSRFSEVPSTTIGKGLLFSYLPTLPKTSSSSTSVSKALLSAQPRLPLPPIEILSKPRGPITTPARAPILKPKHPKELVVLHPAPQPPTISHIPRLKKPQRLVELHPPPPPPPPVIEQPNQIPRPRRSSGCSVKDLVRGFEEIQAVSRDKLKYNLGWKTYSGGQKRPQWKP